MAQRLQIDDSLGRQQVRPVADQVDTFTHPNAGAGLAQLAQSLGQFAPQVAELGVTLGQRKAQEDVAAGEQFARKAQESQETYRTAIQKGLITPSQSPWFRYGAKIQFGQTEADKLATALKIAVDQNMKGESDPQKFEQYAQGFIKDWVTENVGDDNRDAAFEKGFGERLDAHVESMREEWASQAGKQLESDAEANYFAQITNALDTESSRKDVPFETVYQRAADAINLANQTYVQNGGDKKVANQAVIESVVAFAKDRNDARFLNVLKNVRTGTGSLYNTRDAQKVIENAREDIANESMRRQRVADAQEAKQREETVKTLTGQGISLLLDGSNPMGHRAEVDGIARQLNKVDPGAALDLLSARQRVTESADASNPNTVEHALASIWGETDPSKPDFFTTNDLIKVMGHDVSKSDAVLLRNQIDQRDAALAGRGGKDGGPFADPQYKQAISQLKLTFGGDNTITSTAAIASYRAQAELTQRWIQWRQGEGANAGQDQANTFLNQLVDAETAKWNAEAGIKISTRASIAEDVPKANVGGVKTDSTTQKKPDTSWWSKARTAPPTSLKEMQERLMSGHLTQADQDFAKQFGIASPDELAKFLKAQLSIQ